MLKILVVTIFMLGMSIDHLWAQTTIASMKASCKASKAVAHLVDVKVGIKYKPNAEQLQSKLEKIDTNVYCDCVMSSFEKAFGAKRMSTMMQFSGQGTVDTPDEIAKKAQIYFSCFGSQFHQAALQPPSPTEIKRVLTLPNPKHNEQVVLRKNLAKMKNLKLFVQLYENDYKTLPKSLTDLLTFEGSSLKENDLKDVWSRAYIYKIIGTGFELRSVGFDGKLNTVDDVILIN